MKIFLMIIQIIPALIDIIHKVEQIIPESGKGKEKLAMVKEMLAAAYEGVSDALPQIEKVVSVVVDFLNRMGVFRSGGNA